MKVILADDEKYALESLENEAKKVLPQVDIFTCKSAEEVLETIDRISGVPIIYVFTDITMRGGMDGIELAKSLRNEYPRIQVFFVTGDSEYNLVQKGIPIERCILKPVTEEKIREIIHAENK